MIRRNLTDRLLEALADTPTVLVDGDRQTGKSTLAQSVDERGESRQYLTFDDPGILAAAKGDPNGFVAGLNTPVAVGRSAACPRNLPRDQSCHRSQAAAWSISAYRIGERIALA